MISRDYLVITCDISQERLESDIIIFGVRVHLLVAHAAVNRGVVGSSPARADRRENPHARAQRFPDSKEIVLLFGMAVKWKPQ